MDIKLLKLVTWMVKNYIDLIQALLIKNNLRLIKIISL